jgi:3-hydroxyisobutyrate dehydrogenase
MPLMVYWQALGETLGLCRDIDVEPAHLMDLFADTSGGPNVLKVRGVAIADMLKGGDGGEATFDIDSCRKDLRIMLAEGQARGLAMPLVERTLACFDEAGNLGPAFPPALRASCGLRRIIKHPRTAPAYRAAAAPRTP